MYATTANAPVSPAPSLPSRAEACFLATSDPKAGPAPLRIVAGGMPASKEERTVSADLKGQLIALLPRLRRFARTLTRSVSEADDLVQEACLKALSQPEKWDPTQPLDRWMFRITRNLWISEIRKRKVRIGEGQVPAEESHELVEAHTGEDSMMARDLRQTIDALPSELSSVLLVVSVEGYSYAEAAELLDIPVGTVMSRIHRARKTLAKQLDSAQGASQ